MSIVFYPKSAQLMENLDDGKNQDPYVIIQIGKTSMKNAPHYNGGKYPRFDQKPLSFNLSGESAGMVHVVDWDGVDRQGKLQDELIGSGELNLNQLQQQGSGDITIKLAYNGTYQGTVTLSFRSGGSSSSGGSQPRANSRQRSNNKPRDPNEGKKIGQYLLQKKLGEGSYGQAYKSLDTKTNEIVCVKKIPKSKISHPMEKQMFMSEIKCMRKFTHENIIRLYDLLESGTSYYLVMQLCDQGDVRKYMEKKGVSFLKEEEAVFFLKQVAMGFAELHKGNVMHRDFKTDNLFMHESTVIIADLGFAKAGKTMTTTGCGTPIYMAPEVAEGKAYNSLVDMWSIGVTFYEMLFGGFPFNGNDAADIARKGKYYGGNNLKIPQHINRVSPECEDILKKMLTYNPNQRISWQAFFKHRLFDDNKRQKEQTYNPLGSTMAFATKTNNRFEGYRQAEPPQMIQEENDACNEMYKEGEGDMDGIEIIKEEEEEVSDTVFATIIEEEDSGHNHQQCEEINSRYRFEKEKLEFMRRVSCELQYQANKMLMPEFNNAVNDPNMMGQLNANGVPAITLASLVILKVTKTFMDYNLKSQGKNLFNQEGFEVWQSQCCFEAMTALYTAKNDELNDNWNEFMNQAQKVNWSSEDKVHIIDKLNGAIDMQMLRNVLKAKITDMSYLLDFPGFNEDMKCKIAQCIIYTHMANKVNDIFAFSDDFSSGVIFAKFEMMQFDQLKKIVESYK